MSTTTWGKTFTRIRHLRYPPGDEAVLSTLGRNMLAQTKPAQIPPTPESLWPEVERKSAPRPSWVARVLFSRGFEKVMSALEKMFGAPLEADGTQIVTAEKITTGLLNDLFERRICALHIPNFCTPEVAANLNEWIMEKTGLNNWKVNVFRNGEVEAVDSDTAYGIGIPFGLAVKSKAAFIKYFEEAGPLTREIQKVSQGLSPLDRLLTDFNEAWPGGARIAKYRGLERAVGLARVMRPEGLYGGIAKTEGVVHVDTLPVVKKGVGRFSANVYLHVPPDGGDLAVYNVNPKWIELLRNFALIKHLLNFDADAQEYIRSKLPQPLVIRPEVGDLILIDTSRPHAVRGFQEGHRATLQCWADYVANSYIALYS